MLPILMVSAVVSPGDTGFLRSCFQNAIEQNSERNPFGCVHGSTIKSCLDTPDKFLWQKGFEQQIDARFEYPVVADGLIRIT